MYSSNSSHNGNDPISFSDQLFSRTTFLKHSNCNSKQENSRHLTPPSPQPLPSPPLFFHFPSPFDDDQIYLQNHRDLLLHQSIAEAVVNNMDASISNKIPSNKGQRTNSEQIPRKRSCKRDRHSKINTARGLRDRRMRLSLEVARRFFGLQDMLGFDKASKTVEWLLNLAKDEIKQLAREKNHLSFNNAAVKSASSTSECEGVSSLDEVAVSKNLEQEAVRSVKTRRIKRSRMSTFHPLAKESREKARERARERTKEKMRSRKLLADESKQHNEETNHDLSKLGSWNPFENGEESGNQSQNMNMAHEIEERSSQAKEHLGSTVNDMALDDPLVILSKWSPNMIFSSLNNSGMLQEHQFIAEFQSFSKPWEAYNNPI